MDRRVFLALGILAAAAGSPAFAEQVRLAAEKRNMLHVRSADLVRAIYRVALSRDGLRVGTRCLVKLGHNATEARQMATLAISIARKSGSVERFLMLGGGRRPPDLQLDAREMALLRRLGTDRRPAIVLDGRTWEGTSGRTWEGSSLAANPSNPMGPAVVWDGRTWEGSEV